MGTEADIIVIGAGIAGVSAAAALATDASVILVEAETQPGYHATGRSAAYFAPAYGNQVVRDITAMSESFFRQPPPGFTDTPLLRPRSSLFVARADQQAALTAMRVDNAALVPVPGDSLQDYVPCLRRDVLAAGLVDAEGGDLDVDAILQGFLRRFRAGGGDLKTASRVQSLGLSDGAWQLQVDGNVLSAPLIVNAAGAWADNVATLAGLAPLGLVPKRRTAVLIDAPADVPIGAWPLVIDVDEDFYFKPEAGQILVSPADETPSQPVDAQPEEIDVAIAIDRFTQVVDLEVRKINHRWAGLRTFAPDNTFVVGFDPRAKGFFWLAGQGGYGVQSAPAMAQLSKHLVLGTALPGGFSGLARVVNAVAPDRLL